MRLNSVLFALGTCLILPVSAKTCEFGSWRGIANLKSQEQVNELLQDCTIVTGDLEIADEYEGSLFIPGVERLRGRFRGGWNGGVPQIVFKDLEFLSEMSLDNLTGLHTLSFPKLTEAFSFSVSSTRLVDIDVPVLFNATDFQVTGLIASLHAPLLFNVSSFYSGRQEVYGFNYTDGYNGFNLNLPSLEWVKQLVLVGPFKDIILPILKAISPDRRYGGYNVASQIETKPALNISFPSLVTAQDLKINCDRSLSMPLLETAGDISLTVMNNTNITLPSLKTAEIILVTGSATDVSFPVLTNASSIIIEASGYTPMNCSKSANDWARFNSTIPQADVERCRTDWSYKCRHYSCSFNNLTPVKKKKVLSKKEISGICAGTVIGLTGLGVLVYWLFHRRSKDAAVTIQRDDTLEMDGVTIMGDAGADEREAEAGVLSERKDSKDTVVVDVDGGVGDPPRT